MFLDLSQMSKDINLNLNDKSLKCIVLQSKTIVGSHPIWIHAFN